MKTTTALIGLLSFASSCTVYTQDTYVEPATETIIVQDVNSTPYVVSGYAGVWFDQVYLDDVWVFEVTADDPDSPWDVVSVFADVYDEYRGGVLIETFELYPTDDPRIWYSDWFGSTTLLDPFYNGYTVDLVAYDSYDSFDWITVVPEVY